MILKINLNFTLKARIGLFLLSIIPYLYLLIFMSDRYQGDIHYCLILPVVSGAYCFGLPGGILTGLLALPVNMIILWVLGKPEYSPSSYIMAQISSLIVGTGLGLTRSYFNKLHKEIQERYLEENELRRALEEKELLFKELNHRVKNNLNLVKSLIQLQIYRTSSKSFKREGEKLISRILSISLVHEQLYSGKLGDRIELKSYIERLMDHLFFSQSHERISKGYKSLIEEIRIPLDKAILLGLIVNEIITNSLKYAFPPEFIGLPELRLYLKNRHGFLILNIEDNGIGFEAKEPEGLGMVLVDSLSKQLKGKYGFEKTLKGTKFYFTMPMEDN